MVTSKLVGAGAFLVIGLLLFTVALFTIGERRMLFEDRFDVYTEYAKLGQLEVGAVVRVAGADAGEVTGIQIPSSPAGKFRVKMRIREDLHGLVRTDSVATTQTEGLVGAIFVNIGAGSEAEPPVPAGGTIPSQEPFSMADLLAQMSDTVTMVNETVEALRGDIQKAVQQVALTAEDAHSMFEDLRPDITAMARDGRRIASDTQQIVADINAGKGTIGKLMKDDAIYRRAEEIATQARDVVANMKEVTADARRAISDFRSKDGPAQGLMADMRVTVNQAREAVSDLADNMEAMKRNFLLRGFFNRRGYFDLDAISPVDYRSGVLENGKRKAMRIWLSAERLFDTLPDGTPVLSDDGKAQIDSAMSTYLKYVPSYPLVVEGYATEGIKEERWRRAQMWSGMVRQYLLQRYDLTPQMTGYISLGNDAQGSPTDGPWDGVAIALFVDREALQFAGQSSLAPQQK
jgi:phospholipid/cholesterol/gamma-HCH transport system substrate-binding protein